MNLCCETWRHFVGEKRRYRKQKSDSWRFWRVRFESSFQFRIKSKWLVSKSYIHDLHRGVSVFCMYLYAKLFFFCIGKGTKQEAGTFYLTKHSAILLLSFISHWLWIEKIVLLLLFKVTLSRKKVIEFQCYFIMGKFWRQIFFFKANLIRGTMTGWWSFDLNGAKLSAVYFYSVYDSIR